MTRTLQRDGRRRWVREAAAWALIMLLSTLAAFVLWRYDERVVNEHHVIESAQAGLLILAGLVHFVRSRRQVDKPGRVLYAGLALFCISLGVRETDIDRLGASAYWPMIEVAVRASVVALWMLLAWRLVPVFADLWRSRRSLLISRCGLYTMIGCTLYALSYPFDKQMLPLAESPSMLVEETIQLNACLLLLAAAVTSALVARWHVQEADRWAGRDGFPHELSVIDPGTGSNR